MELRARGWSVRAAAREVGVSRSRGQTGRAVTTCTATVWWSGSWRHWTASRCDRSVRATCLRTNASRSPICESPV
ncbi:hypothetical protein [Mycolicibacterium mengxianglii]|uniref:hypothetical protein n=1 Tax=Mycolicibacterium mengxianglii TaxID=2736649 RepID=UPI003FD81BE2